MSPALGTLPTNTPVKVGRGVTNWGTAGSEINYNNTVALNTMANINPISFTPLARDGYIFGSAQTVWRCPDAAWTCADWGLRLVPADLDGVQDYYCRTTVHAAISYHSDRCEGAYRVGGGISYTLYMMWFGSPIGYNQVVYTGHPHHYLNAYVAGEERIT